MFASDYNKKGVAISYTISITLHIIALLLFFFIQNKHKKALLDYTLTEITIIEEIPDEKPKEQPVQIEKPKKMFDILKQVIPVKQKASIEVAKPKTLEIEKPKIDIKKPQALSLEKVDDKLKPAVKAIDLDNEIGQKKISPAMMKQQLELQQQQKQLAASPQKLDLSQTASKKSSFLPVERPAISTDAVQKGSAFKVSSLKLGQPTPEVQEKKVKEEQIVIKKEKGAALLLTGQIENRAILRRFVPTYPRWAQEQGIEAQVAIYFVVRPDGTVKDNAYVSRGSGYPELDQIALEAILKFQFAPLSPSEKQEDQSGTAIFKFQLIK